MVDDRLERQVIKALIRASAQELTAVKLIDFRETLGVSYAESEKGLRQASKPGYRLELLFEDGTQDGICLKNRLFGPMFEPLKNPGFFAQVHVDEFDAVCWPNGANLAPDALYREIQRVTLCAVKPIVEVNR